MRGTGLVQYAENAGVGRRRTDEREVAMKAVKRLLKVLLWIVGLAVLAVLLLPLWIGPAAKCGANAIVPRIVGVPFHLGEFAFNQYTGHFRAGDIQLRNPERFYTPSEKKAKAASEVKGEGILGTALAHAGNAAAAAADAANAALDAVVSSETNAFTLGALDVKFSPLSVLTDTVRIDEIKIDGLYLYGDLSFSNLREIASNAFGEDEDAEKGKQKDAKKDAEDSEGGKKVEIGLVSITGAKIQWGHAAVPLPDIEIRDIGKEEGGATSEGALDKIVEGVCDAADKVCAGAGSALKLALEGAEGAAGALGAAAGSAADAASDATKAVGEAAGAAVDAVKGVFGGK